MHSSEHQLIARWIQPNSQVLDLGCGDGSLLSFLRDEKNVQGYGIELKTDRVLQSLSKGIPVIQADLDHGISNYFASSNIRFDYVVMSATLPAMFYPRELLREMLAIGEEVIVSFPNFGHWRARIQMLMGHIPQSRIDPEPWYQGETIRLFTIEDFEAFCQEEGIVICERYFVDINYQRPWWIRWQPYWFSALAFYRLTGMVMEEKNNNIKVLKKPSAPPHQQNLIEAKEKNA